MSKLETGLHYPLTLDALPPNWQVGYVGDFADEIQPGFASGKHNKEGAGIPHIRPYNIDRQGKLDLSEIKSVAPDSDAKRLKTDDVLFNNTNSPELIGKTAVIASAGDWGFSNHMTRIRFKDDVAPKFAAYQLHFLWMTGYYLHNCVKHVNQASISSKTLANAVPFIAPPLDQQKRIVVEIEKQFSRLDEAIANLKRVKANLKRYQAAVLKAAVEGRLVETEAELARREGRSYETGERLLHRILETRRRQWQGKGKYKEPAAPDTTDLPELPVGWVWACAEQLSDFVTKGTTPSADKLSEQVGDVQFLKVYNLTFDGALDHAYKPAFVSRTTHEVELARSKVRSGDVLMNIVGPPLGQVSIVPPTLREANINQAIARYRPVAPITSTFFALLLKTEDVVRWATSRAKTTAGQSNLTLELCRALPLPLPPLPEQHRVVAEVDRRLSLLRDTEAQVDANLRRAGRLRQSILSKAFSA